MAHVAGATLIPMDELPERVEQIPLGRRRCTSSARPGHAAIASAEWLFAQGFDATNVIGGTRAWIEAGKPTVSGPDPG